MKILILSDRIPPENRGGAEIIAWNLALGLQDEGHDVHVIAGTPNASFREVRDGIPTYHIHSTYPERWHAYLSLYNPQTVGAIRKLYQEIQPDVINAHNIHYDLSYQSMNIAKRMNIPVVFTSHDVMPFAYAKSNHWIDPEYCGVKSPEQYRLPTGYNRRQMRFRYNPIRNLFIRRTLRKSTQFRVTPSDALRQAHLTNDLPSPYHVVHNGIDPQRFVTSPEVIETLRNRLDLHDRRVILFGGRLTGGKGVKELMEALEIVVKDVPETTLLVLSATPIDKQIQDEKYTYLKENHIRSGGWLSGEELVAAFHIADIVTVPSIIMDTFPTVNIEGMVCGTPVVATCYGGSDEAVIDGKTGYIINPFKTAGFAEKLTRLLKDDDLRQQMGDAGKQHIQENFLLKKQVQEMLALYQQAINLI